MLRKVEIIERARNHGRNSENRVRPPLAVSSILFHGDGICATQVDDCAQDGGSEEV